MQSGFLVVVDDQSRIRLQEESKERTSGGEDATGLGSAAGAGRWDWGPGGGRWVWSAETASTTDCQKVNNGNTYAVPVGATTGAEDHPPAGELGYGAAGEEAAGQSVTYAAQLVTVTSVVTSTVDVPQPVE
jgi:hypothetical protein